MSKPLIAVEWTPGRWWRVIAPDGGLWCETSRESEAREARREGDRLERQFVADEVLWIDVDDPLEPDTVIKPGMLVEVDHDGGRVPIERISIALCPRRDPAAEGVAAHTIVSGGGEETEILASAVDVEAIEAALLRFAALSLGNGKWCYGRQVTAVYGKDDEG